MKESRLFKILYYLLTHKQATAVELAEEFEVSVRTIYRDIDNLSSAGIPVYAMQGKGGGIALMEGFTLDQTMFSKMEQEQILNALQGLIVTESEQSNELLMKLSAIFHIHSTNWIEIDFSGWSQQKPQQDIFVHIKKAILERYVIAFDYFHYLGKIEKRHIQPLKLVFKSKAWYVYGYCLLRNDYRFFKLTRITHLQITYEKFLPQKIDIPHDIVEEDENLVTGLLKFDNSMAFRIYDEFPCDDIRKQGDYLLVETSLPHNHVLYSYILSFGEHVEIIKPQEIREEMHNHLKKLQEKYKT